MQQELPPAMHSTSFWQEHPTIRVSTMLQEQRAARMGLMEMMKGKMRMMQKCQRCPMSDWGLRASQTQMGPAW
jgi:hypothetical protein